MKQIIRIAFILIIVLAVSCRNHRNDELVLLKVTELGSARVSDSSIVKVLHEQIHKDIKIKYSLSEDTALQQLQDKRVDLAIIPNITEGCGDVVNLRTIMPLLPRILVILAYNIPNAQGLSVKELFENNVMVFEDMSRLDSIFFHKFFVNYGIDPKKLNSYMVHKVDTRNWEKSSFVFVGLTHLHNPIMKDLINNGAEFIGLDKVSELGKGSSVEGMSMVFPKLHPFVLPKSFYNGKPKEPILTIAIPDILVACRDLDDVTVYKIIKTITENKAQLIQNDNIYNLLNTQKNHELFSFPLHEGAKHYIRRNEPSVWTRYASTIWPFLSIIAIIAGGIASLHQYIRQRKRVRIESLYTELLQIRKRAFVSNDSEKRETLLKELRNIRSKAFDALMENKLSTDESFSIFLSLYGEIITEIDEMNPIEKSTGKA
jgi:hypothetical protein